MAAGRAADRLPCSAGDHAAGDEVAPLRLSDLIGLDTLKLIGDKMFEEFKRIFLV